MLRLVGKNFNVNACNSHNLSSTFGAEEQAAVNPPIVSTRLAWYALLVSYKPHGLVPAVVDITPVDK